MPPDECIHRGLEFAGKAWECLLEDFKTETGGGAGGESQEMAQEERAKRWRMSSDGWTWRENASARQVHPVSASFLISRRIATNA